MATTVGPVYIK